MRWTRLARTMFLGVSLLCLGLPEAEALEIFAPPGVATHMDDGLITQVRGARRGGGGMHRGGGGMHRGGGGMHRGGERIVVAARIAAGVECTAAAGRIAAAALSRRRLPWRRGIPRWRLPWRSVPWRSVPRGRVSRRRLSCRRGLSLWRLDSSHWVRLGAWRRHCGRRGDRLRQRGGGGVLGRGGSGAWPVLVLYRPEPAAGLLGRLPVSS